MRARFLLLAAALAAFGGSLFAGFHLDDYAIFSDPLPRVGSVLRAWPHPLTHFIDWLNYQVAGQEPMGYHAVNLLLHLGAVLLAYECLRRILPATAAVLAAAIFAVHPLQAEAVDYVAARGAMLAAVLCFAALLAWIAGRPWIALAAFAGALLADERCALFPAVLTMVQWGCPPGGRPVGRGTPSSRSLVDYCGRERYATDATGGVRADQGGRAGDRPLGVNFASTEHCSGPTSGAGADRVSNRQESVTAKLTLIGVRPTFALAAAFGLGIGLGGAAAVRAHATAYAYALVALRFLRLLVLPWGFTIAPDVHEPRWLAVAAAATIVAVVLWRWRRLSVHSELSWLLIGLLLLVPSFSAAPAADPRAYLPLFAFAAAAGLLLARVPARALGTAAVAILTAVSVGRTYVWMSEERLWREAVRRAPGMVEPKIQLAKQLRAADALELLDRAREQAPYNSEIPAGIGKVLLDEQQYQGAVDELSRAVALNPRNALAFNNRGVALAALGQSSAAAADFRHALALDPHLAEARENLKRLGAR